MYVSPFVSRENSNTPKEYKIRARDEITRKLNIQPTTPKPSLLSSTTSKVKATDLRHGSSPLNKVTNASDTSLSRWNSNESVESIDSTASGDERHRKLFGISKWKQHISRSSSSGSKQASSLGLNVIHEQQQHQEQTTAEEDVMDVDMDAVSLDRTPTNISSQTASTNQQSLFSYQNSLATQFTNFSISQPKQQQQQIYLTLEECLPQTFTDLYSSELLTDKATLINGRPSFTINRPLQNWRLNDIRSLLIVSELKPQWCGQLPIIYNPQGFKMVLLPLDSTDEQIINTLVESDIYKESGFEKEFRWQTAKYTVQTARVRHQQLMQRLDISNVLSKPEWRNIIENFMLNLGVESECRLEYKMAMHDLKKFKKNHGMSKGKVSDKGNNLLKKALLNESALQAGQGKLSKEEKFQLWKGVQSLVYTRLGLDWKPDN